MVDQTSLKAMEQNLRRFDDRARGLAQALSDLRALNRARLSAASPAQVRPALTERELAILRLIAAGKDNAEIAAELHYGLGTIKLHIREILDALDAPTRAAAAARAIRLGII
ncbi:MAG: response regulator transcription factor [Candidatus Eremiobacteraeota bacterium]|nr:response regulator transcription factor [Candidatus Eremiobacteraeota bacterium]